jgi:adenosylcobinamide-GDP ribazoletransferase
VVTLVLVLLLKFCALWVLVEHGAGGVLVLAPVVGRAAMLGLFLTTPYVRAGGLGAALAEHLPRQAAGWVLLGCALASVVLGGWSVFWLLGLVLLVFGGLRRLMCKRLGGTTGMTAGRCWNCWSWPWWLGWRYWPADCSIASDGLMNPETFATSILRVYTRIHVDQ